MNKAQKRTLEAVATVGVILTVWAFGLIGAAVLWGIPYGIYRLVKKIRTKEVTA